MISLNVTNYVTYNIQAGLGTVQNPFFPINNYLYPEGNTTTVQTAINLEAISTSVQGAVAAQMLKTAQEALVANNLQANQQATQTLSGQTAALDAQAKLLLQPIQNQMKILGDTVAALAHAGVTEDFTFVSTAGGAFLEWMEGKPLPGVDALNIT